MARQMRSACPQTRMVLVADEDDARLRDRATQAGATHFVTKEKLLELPQLLSAT